MTDDQITRMAQANQLLARIACTGREFFSHRGAVSHFYQGNAGRLWWFDTNSRRRVWIHQRTGRWRGFTEGGTLRTLVYELRTYILFGTPMHPQRLGPWPQWICEGDLWGYGLGAMEAIRA